MSRLLLVIFSIEKQFTLINWQFSFVVKFFVRFFNCISLYSVFVNGLQQCMPTELQKNLKIFFDNASCLGKW